MGIERCLRIIPKKEEPYFSIPRFIVGFSIWTVLSISQSGIIGDPDLPYSSPNSTIGKIVTVSALGLGLGLVCGLKFKKISGDALQ